jgi:hypothetical protein
MPAPGILLLGLQVPTTLCCACTRHSHAQPAGTHRTAPALGITMPSLQVPTVLHSAFPCSACRYPPHRACTQHCHAQPAGAHCTCTQHSHAQPVGTVTNTPDLVIDPDDNDDDLELYDAPVRPPVKPRFIDVARLANAWCQHYPETARRGNNVEPQNVVEAEDDRQHLAYPHRCHNTNVSTPFSTLYPGTTIQCHFISATNLLEVAMKKS